MNCPFCDAPNRDDAAFCRACGRLLRAACPRCGAAAGPGANFCDTCGAPLSPQAWTGASPGIVAPPTSHFAESPPPAGTAGPISLDRFIPRELMAKLTAARGATAERRVVTMLFCDLKGSTAFAERLDPEEWTEIVNGAFEQMVPPIYRYEGTVARLMGDGLLAFFGAPIAHEDDPRRAVLAGLGIVEGIHAYRETLTAAGRDLDVRVGINTGLVVVGAVGSDLRLEYSAIGDAINLASRMEQAAEPGTVQIAEDTYRLVADQFEVQPLGGIPVKGKTQPVAAYRVLRRVGGRRRAASSLAVALVNRRMEWETLERAFAALGAGRGSLLFLTGDAGLGKTRLIDEAAERLLPLLEGARMIDVSAVSYETSRPYGLLGRLLRRSLGLEAGDPPEIARERLIEFTDETDATTLETILGSAAPAGSAEAAGEAFTRQLDAALDRYWRARARGGPLVLALDELQWLDASSAERLAHLFSLTENAPVLFLCALRRDRRSSGWSLKEAAGRDLPHRLDEVTLHPLSDSESRMMLGELLGEAELPDAWVALILEKAEGNPLFLEEVARHLIERGALDQSRENGAADPAAGFTLPDSLLGLLTARIDRLDEATRRTLQAAAVIGRTFGRAPLADLVDDPDTLDGHLVELQRMELIREVSRVPEPTYTFNHSLTHEAVYNTILVKQRRAMHRRVAESLEERAGGAPQSAAVLADHFLEADAPERALPYLLQAGSEAFRLHAPAEAVTHYNRALPIALGPAGTHEQLVEICVNRGRAFELQSRFAEAKASYEQFERLAIERQDRALELKALIGLGTLHANVTPYHDAVKGRALMERAMALAESTGDQVSEVRILWNLVNIDRFGLNSLDKAVANGERALALARELGLDEELAYLLNDLGDVYGTVGRFDESYQLLKEAGERWQSLGNEAMLADSLSSLAVWASIKGELSNAYDLARRANEISTRLENVWGQAYSLAMMGQVTGLIGNIGQSLVMLEEAMNKARLAGFIGGQVIGLSYLSRVYLEAGDWETAEARARGGLDIAREHLPQFAPMCIGRLALALFAQGKNDAAAETLDDLAVFGEKHQLFVKFDRGLATIELALARGHPEEALRLADESLHYLIQADAKQWLPSLRHSRARALVVMGRLDEASEELAEAAGEARSIGLRLGVWRLLAGRAAVEVERGNEAAAAALRAEASAEVDYLAERVFPDALRAVFLAQAKATLA